MTDDLRLQLDVVEAVGNVGRASRALGDAGLLSHPFDKLRAGSIAKRGRKGWGTLGRGCSGRVTHSHPVAKTGRQGWGSRHLEGGAGGGACAEHGTGGGVVLAVARCLLEAGGDHGDLYFVLHLLVEHGAEDDIGV